jgi:glutamyl-tRNA synthetase
MKLGEPEQPFWRLGRDARPGKLRVECVPAIRVFVYRGRIAPSPTGFLHLGHARTFWTAFERARANRGTLVLRIEDLDADRRRPEFAEAITEDLRWFGLEWDEGPDVGGPFGPYAQSLRRPFYLEAWERLRAAGVIYPCACSRRDIERSLSAPHAAEDEPLYPGTCRPAVPVIPRAASPAGASWRFRVPPDDVVRFVDGLEGKQAAVAGVDFGDFVVWRRDDVPAYQLAVVVDDIAMRITEVVRGVDLLTSTFRQLLLYEALGARPPQFHHCPLVTDGSGKRLAKREAALSLRTLRQDGVQPSALRTPSPITPA